jgi:hypothetical protein
MNSIFIWIGIDIFLILLLIIFTILLIIISKKTHSFIELKSSFKGSPIAIFFEDNRYCEWVSENPDAGLIEDKKHGTFIIDSTYIDKKTNIIFCPFNSIFALSLNVRAAKLADDLTYIFKEQEYRKLFKQGIIKGQVKDTDGFYTLRTSIDFSSIKHFVSPILPHNIQSKVINTVRIRLGSKMAGNMQNIILLVISALGAIILGGLVLKYVVFV